MSRDIAQLIKRLRALPGWEVELKRGGHYAARGPRRALCHFSSTPSDPRAVSNIKAQLRRLGADI
jgi:hypothetical protein